MLEGLAANRGCAITDLLDGGTTQGSPRCPVDVVVNLVADSREDTEALLEVTKPGGVLVSATSPGGEFAEPDATVIFFSVRRVRRVIRSSARSLSESSPCQ